MNESALKGSAGVASRSGATHMGYELAQEFGVTLIARAKSRHFAALNIDSKIFDAMPNR